LLNTPGFLSISIHQKRDNNMKHLTLSFLTLLVSLAKAQEFEGLSKMLVGSLSVFYSEGEEVSAQFSGQICDEANSYFMETLSPLQVPFQLLVLAQKDWNSFADSRLIYGMPHYLADGRTLVVAAEDNTFWKRQLPDFATLSSPYKELFPITYQINGEISSRYFFDLLAVHELGHAWHTAARLNTQRKWLSELFCNIMLHTYIEQKKPEFLGALITLPAYWASRDTDDLTYTTLAQFETDYYQIGTANPFNYAWYQYRFHHAAKLLYDAGGEALMQKLWAFLGKYQDKLSDEELADRLAEEVHPYFRHLIDNW